MTSNVSMLTLVVAVLLLAAFIGSVALIISNRIRALGGNTDPKDVLDAATIAKIKDEALEFFHKAVLLYSANGDGYDAIEKFVLENLLQLIETGNLFPAAVKALVTAETLQALLGPYLKTLFVAQMKYEQKMMVLPGPSEK